MTWKISTSNRDPDWIVVIGPFDYEFKEGLKRKIPAEFRDWRDILKAWLIHRSYRSVVEYLIEKHGDQAPQLQAEIHDVTEIASRVGDRAPKILHDWIMEGLTLGIEAIHPSAKLEGLIVRTDGNKILIVSGFTTNE